MCFVLKMMNSVSIREHRADQAPYLENDQAPYLENDQAPYLENDEFCQAEGSQAFCCVRAA